MSPSQAPSAKWGVHINAKYAIHRLLHILHIKLHIFALFHCIFFAFVARFSINFFVHEDNSIPFDLHLSTADTIYFLLHAGGKLQATATSAQEVSDLNLN